MIAKRNSHAADVAESRPLRTAPGAPGIARTAKQSAAQTMTRFVVEHPVLVLSAALIAGACLGWLIKRRR